MIFCFFIRIAANTFVLGLHHEVLYSNFVYCNATDASTRMKGAVQYELCVSNYVVAALSVFRQVKYH